MANFKIPHVALSDQEKRQCMDVMREGNDLMKAWAEDAYGRKNCSTKLRRGLFKWVANPQDPEAIDPAKIGIPKSVVDVMLSVRTVESKVMFGHVRMVVKLARRYAWLLPMTYLDFDDLILEGLIALREAIYSFDRHDATFTTYSYWAVKRRLRKKINKATNSGGFTTKGFKLLEKYNATRMKLEKDFGGKVGMGTVIMGMKIEEGDIRHLKSMLQRVVRASSLAGNDPDSNPYENLGTDCEVRDIDIQLLIETLDKQGKTEMQREIVVAAAKGQIPYEEAATKVQIGDGQRKYKERSALILMATTTDPKVWRRAIQKAELTPIQQELVQAAITGEKHFQSRIADNHINPDTKKPYTRMAITYMLRRAYRAIKMELRQLEVAAA